MIELDYFRKISVKFHFILEQLKEPENKILIQILNAAGNRKLLVCIYKKKEKEVIKNKNFSFTRNGKNLI